MTIEALVYDADGLSTPSVDDPAGLAAARDTEGTTWVRVSDPTEAELDRVSASFDLHTLSLEDIRNGVRPKSEPFDGHTFLLVKEARLARGETSFEDEVAEVPIGLFIGDDWVVTIAPESVGAIDRVYDVLQREESRLLARGPDFTAYRVVDAIVDEYFWLLDEIEDRIEAVEDDVVDEPDITTLEAINEVRRDLLSVRKLLWPTREALSSFARGDPPQIEPETEKYFRDVYDHVVQLVDLVETYRDLASGARDIYLNALSMSTNEVMKKLTVVATVVLPLTFVVGIYGMNFAGGPYNMPELEWTYGYPAVMLGMGLVAVILLSYFRREDWL